METVDDERLGGAREALARGAWEEARELYGAVVAERESGEALEGLGWAGWWLADEQLTFDARERAYRLYRAAGDDVAAGRVATWVAADFREYRGEDAVGRGWLERAHRLLDGQPESDEHGWLSLTNADFALNVDSDLDAVVAFARDGLECGRRLGAVDVEAVGLALLGLAHVARGAIEDGMARLDEASAIAAAEEMRLPIASGWALCCALSACDGVGDFPRAVQWCGAIRRFTERWGGRQLLGVCRTSYGRILAVSGDWPAAESELLAAIGDMERARPGMSTSGFFRLGELRARQGRDDDARELFERAGASGFVGLGRLALADGDAASATELAERVLRRLPASSLLDRLPALELRARARIHAGDLAGAQAASDELERATDAFGTPYVAGVAGVVRCELALAAGEYEQARKAGEDAIDCFEEASAPYDVARARVELARALAALGRADGCEREAGAAREAFERLGAARDLVAVEQLLRGGESDGAATRPGRSLGDLTPRELDVLRLVARGMSDAEIAEALVVSPHTVHRHVANVRAKLRLHSRSAAVAYAAREGLL